ncbi:hypothetical protein Tco_0806468 [Tanacetum coccineum]
MVKKLKKKDKSRTHKLKRLYKVGLTAMVESTGDEEDLGNDASKQGRRINVIDADEDITLVNVQDDADNEMFDVNVLNGDEVFVAGKNENVVKEVVNVAQVSTVATTVTITTEEITLAQALEALKTSKPKDKGKGIMIEEPVKPMKKKDQINFVPPHNSMCVPLSAWSIIWIYCSILILQISYSPGLSMGTLDAATICAES